MQHEVAWPSRRSVRSSCSGCGSSTRSSAAVGAPARCRRRSHTTRRGRADPAGEPYWNSQAGERHPRGRPTTTRRRGRASTRAAAAAEGPPGASLFVVRKMRKGEWPIQRRRPALRVLQVWDGDARRDDDRQGDGVVEGLRLRLLRLRPGGRRRARAGARLVDGGARDEGREDARDLEKARAAA